jgi:hypothetical protein
MTAGENREEGVWGWLPAASLAPWATAAAEKEGGEEEGEG